jgi:hypothetical protein
VSGTAVDHAGRADEGLGGHLDERREELLDERWCCRAAMRPFLVPPPWEPVRVMGYGELRRYRSRRSVQRLVIPGALAALVVGGAVGAAASFFATHSTTPPPPASGHAGRTATSSPRSPVTSAATTTHSGSTTGAPPATGGTATAGSVTAGERLNDQGYALIRQGQYAAAVPLLRRAVVDLRGTGPANPYEAYANYNLGYALLNDGSCAAALPPLATAKQLETSLLVGIAIRHAQACSPAGS